MVAILLGVGLGLLMKSWFDTPWLLWVGVFWGVGGAILNIYKAYQKQVKSFDELKDDVRYKNMSKKARTMMRISFGKVALILIFY